MLAQYDVILAREQPELAYCQRVTSASKHTPAISATPTATARKSPRSSPAAAWRSPANFKASHRVSIWFGACAGQHGAGLYSDVISGVQWVINQRQRYGIRVINLSLGAPVRAFTGKIR